MKMRAQSAGSYRGLAAVLLAIGLAGWFNPSAALALQALEGPGAAAVTSDVVSASFQLSLGWLNGTAHETVYDYPHGGGRNKASELTWDLKNLAMLGGEVSVRVFDRLRLNAGFWGALNRGNGQMDDYDWMLDEEGSPWTDWSLSEVDVTRAYIFDINASVEFLRMAPVGLRVLLGYKENRWAWEDRALRYIYSSDPTRPDGFRDQTGDLGGVNAINYEQTIRIPYVGLGAALNIRRLDFDVYCNYSPLVQAKDKDHHVLRDVWFEETFRNGNYFGAGARASYTFPCRIFLSLRFDYQVIPEIIGDTEIWGAEGEDSTKDSAGLDNQCWLLGLEGGYAF
jgi:outer membrane protease